jgi:TolA-binding protein
VVRDYDSTFAKSSAILKKGLLTRHKDASMRRPFLACVLAAALSCLPSWAFAQSASGNQILDAFLAAAEKSPSASAEQKRIVGELIKQLRATPEDRAAAITESLRVLYPDYKQALAALGEDNLGAAIVGLMKLRDSADPYLAADATFYLARAYLLDEHFEDALPLLGDLQGKWATKTANGGEVLFLRGITEVALLHHEQASQTLQKFLSQYPDAPERMRIGALRQVEQLKLFQEGTLSDVHLRMDFSRRKLTLVDTGTETRQQQDKIIEILAKLIKEAEERECNCRGGGNGKGQKQGKAGESQSQNPAEGSPEGTTGGRSRGIDTDTVKRLQRGGPQSPWSRLRDKDRDPVYSAIKEKFPARYQQLIEQYYKSFQDDGGQ